MDLHWIHVSTANNLDIDTQSTVCTRSIVRSFVRFLILSFSRSSSTGNYERPWSEKWASCVRVSFHLASRTGRFWYYLRQWWIQKKLYLSNINDLLSLNAIFVFFRLRFQRKNKKPIIYVCYSFSIENLDFYYVDQCETTALIYGRLTVLVVCDKKTQKKSIRIDQSNELETVASVRHSLIPRIFSPSSVSCGSGNSAICSSIFSDNWRIRKASIRLSTSLLSSSFAGVNAMYWTIRNRSLWFGKFPRNISLSKESNLVVKYHEVDESPRPKMILFEDESVEFPVVSDHQQEHWSSHHVLDDPFHYR